MEATMPSLIPTGTILALTGAYNDHFDTFASEIVIIKEPIKSIVSTSSVVLPGYREESNETNYTLTLVSGIFSGLVWTAKDQTLKFHDETNDKIPLGEVRIKVKEDARRYLSEGKTEAIKIGDVYYNQVTDEGRRTFLGTVQYTYSLQRTH